MTSFLILILCLSLAVISLLIWVYRLKKSLQEHFIIERELQYEVGHDELTDLVSIPVAVDRLSQSIRNAKRYENKIAVLYIGVDYFKQVNSSSGFDIINEFLQILSDKLVDTVENNDTVARVNDNEFLVILESFEDIDFVNAAVEDIMKIPDEIFFVKHHKIKCSFSIGISMFPNDKVETMSILYHAFSVMDLVRKDGGNGYKFYTPELSEQAFTNSKIEHELVESIQNNEIQVYYQLVYNAQEDVIIGVEALTRWKNPVMGLVEPDVFIPLSEEIGFVSSIDKWVIQEAVRQYKIWHEDGLRPGVLSLNISFARLEEKGFLEDMKQLMLENECIKGNLCLDITKSKFTLEAKHLVATLNTLKKLGIDVALDNFASNNVSLVYLAKLSLSRLKINRFLIHNIKENEAIIKTIIATAKNLNLAITAKGVQTKEQQDFLFDNACYEMQGDLYNKESSAQVIEKELRLKI